MSKRDRLALKFQKFMDWAIGHPIPERSESDRLAMKRFLDHVDDIEDGKDEPNNG